MLKHSLLILSLFFFISCENKKKEKADLILYNAKIYSVDSLFTIYQALAVKDGKIIALNASDSILNKYDAAEINDLEGKFIFPGFIDSHCHFLNYGLGLQQANLVGTKSFEDVIEKVKEFAKTNKSKWIVGRGWDQNDWAVKEYPNKTKLDLLFPNTPVILKRIDGHAALVNSEALKLAGFTNDSKINGGEFIKDKNGLTGILIDNAVDVVERIIPPVSKEDIRKALLAAQNNCFAVGLTTVDDAGLMKSDIDAMDALQKKGELKMRIYAMLSDSTPNYKYYFENGIYKTEKLNVRSFKFYADGALGSRGACLLKDYSDKPNWKGFLLRPQPHYEKLSDKLDSKGFQMNTHCIGDSAVRLILYTIAAYPMKYGNPNGAFAELSKNRRWRIEHAQVVDRNDLSYIKGLSVIPSIQPTHATSDMYWAKERLGNERIKYAYAYKDLLDAAGIVVLGTDFPVEDISPFKTFYAAVVRKDAKGFPEERFQPENALSREETIRGMTIWGAYANFEENEKGSLEKGKFADFIILDTDLMKCDENKILKTSVLSTYLNGELVYKPD